MNSRERLPFLFSACCFLCFVLQASADPPSTAYIFPAGGQQGKTVEVHVGGYNLHREAAFRLSGEGLEATERIYRIETTFFEGPLIPMPASQAKEDYPKDYYGTIKIAANAPLGTRYWNVSTSQGISATRKFLVGNLPEITEQEINGNPVPQKVSVPVTINGRIHPREDVDVWLFSTQAGKTYTCEVHAARLGSPLDSRLEIRDPSGKQIAENVDALGIDSRVRFRAALDGTYEVRIHDVNFGGLQSYVYRLTITDGPYVDSVYPLGGRRGSTVSLYLTGADIPSEPIQVALPSGNNSAFTYQPLLNGSAANTILLELGDLPEFLEEASPKTVLLPAVLNGRITKPGEADTWNFEAKKGEPFQFEIRAGRLGSPLDSVLTMFDTQGKQLATADDLGNNETDSLLKFKAPADGTYTIQVTDRLASRGGSTYAYRLLATRTEKQSPGFRLTFSSETLTVQRGKEAKLKVNVVRLGGFAEEIELEVENLPEGVALSGNKIAKGKNNTQLVFKAEKTAKVQVAPLKILGKAIVNEVKQKQPASYERGLGEPNSEELLLAVAVETPFKFLAEFQTKYGSRGTVFLRRYKLDRGDFKGPIKIQLADIQARHLQGVTGPNIVLSPGTTQFDYPITLPSWMQIGRTSRTCIMAVGEIEDPDGTKHTVSYSSITQNDQIIVLVDPGRLNVKSLMQNVRAVPGKDVTLPITITRGNGLTGSVTVELIVPRHIQGVSGKTISISADQNSGQLSLNIDTSSLGPFNMPLTIRASIKDERGYPVTAEYNLIVFAD